MLSQMASKKESKTATPIPIGVGFFSILETEETQSYGKRELNNYYLAESYIGDIGESKIENESVRIDLEPIFLECIDQDVMYQVFLTPYGDGHIYVSKREKEYFIVKGDPIMFGWEIKAKRKNKNDLRLASPLNLDLVKDDPKTASEVTAKARSKAIPDDVIPILADYKLLKE